ncbi:MAG: DUF1573 domain-containing protein [Phycisphaerae bacterium]|jgi:hypothetical protein
MKRYCLTSTTVFVIGFACCFLQIGCQEQAAAAEKAKPKLTAPEVNSPAETNSVVVPAEGGPEITFEKVVHEFGKIDPKSRNICEFKFKNTGKSLLKITNVSKTCGCTPFTLEKMEYEPGESGVLKVEYDASSMPTEVKKTLIVSSNDVAKPKVELTIKAEIVAKIDCQPKKLDLLLNKENAGCPAITIKSLDGKPFSIKQVDVVVGRSKSVDNLITVDCNSSAEATEFVLQPKVDVEKLRQQSNISGSVQIAITHPASDMIIVPFEVLPKFKVTPPSLIVYKAEPEKPVKRELWILSNYNEDFEIESTSSKGGAVKVLSQEKLENRYKLELEITPPPMKEGRKFFYTDMLFVNIKGGETLNIQCRILYPR